jgi:hypothetical protein
MGLALLQAGIAVVGSSPGGAAQANNPDTINVIARKPEEARQEAQSFIKATGVAEQPIARWIDPICPVALNVRADAARKVEQRVREIATQSGARLGSAKCVPNLKIVFSAHAQVLVRQLASRFGAFSDLDADSRAVMHGKSAPVRWWHTVQDRTKDGLRPMAGDTPPAAGINAGLGAVVLGGRVHQQYRSSLMSSQMMRGIIAARVIIDVKLAEGTPLNSVAAYAALVSLAEIRLGESAPPASILSLFRPEGPRDLTALDTRFLRTLYRLPLDRTAIAHRGLLLRGLVGEDVEKRDQ